MDFRLRLDLSKDDRIAEITVKKSVPDKDFDGLVKIIKKTREQDINLVPLAKFLKDEELSFLVDHGWSVDGAEFILHPDELLVYYRKRGKFGGSNFDAQSEWPHIPAYELQRANYQLMMNEKIVPTRYFGDKGGYVLKAKYDANQEWGLAQQSKKPRTEPRYKEASKTAPKSENKPSVSLTKKEQSACRKCIIDKATKSDINAGGFKSEFIETLDEKCQSYIKDLSNLQVKFMMSEVTKKDT